MDMFSVNKNRLIDLFIELAEIKSPSGAEEEIAVFVIKKFRELGLLVKRDTHGNVIAKLDGEGEPLIFCAHLDTVAVGKGKKITPIRSKNKIKTGGDTILGADNKDSIAAIIETLTILSERNFKHRPLEIIFTLGEELISEGAKKLNLSSFIGKECVISDVAEPYGTIVISAPYCFQFEIRIKGERSHVKEPEKGINALTIISEVLSRIPLGRIDDLTTSNIAYQITGLDGVINDPQGTFGQLSKNNRNTIPDLAIAYGEVRGAKIGPVNEFLDNIEKILHEVKKYKKAEVEFSKHKLADGYYFEKTDPWY
jgi:tripeptide aminopeptidase